MEMNKLWAKFLWGRSMFNLITSKASNMRKSQMFWKMFERLKMWWNTDLRQASPLSNDHWSVVQHGELGIWYHADKTTQLQIQDGTSTIWGFSLWYLPSHSFENNKSKRQIKNQNQLNLDLNWPCLRAAWSLRTSWNSRRPKFYKVRGFCVTESTA